MNLFPTFPVPDDDPDPSLTDRFRSAGCFRRTPSGSLTDDAVAAMRGTIQSVVNGLQTHDKSFRAVFGGSRTASTDIANRTVNIGTKALDDLTLSEGRLASIMVGLAYHEVAHIRYDRDPNSVITRAFTAHPLGGLCGDVSNIAQDVRIEHHIRRALPGYAGTLDVAMWNIDGRPLIERAPVPSGLSHKGARTLYFAAVRAPWIIADWTPAPEVLEWGQDFARRFERVDKPKAFIEMVGEALDMMLTWTASPEVTPPPIDEPDDDPPPIDEPPPVGPPIDEPPIEDEPPIDGPVGPGGKQPPPEEEPEDEPEGSGGEEDEPTDDDTDDPEGPGGWDDTDDPGDDEPIEDGPEPKGGRGEDTDDDEPRGTEGTDDAHSRDGDDTSGEWSDRDDTAREGPVTSPAAKITEGIDSDQSLDDLDFPSCSSDAAKGTNDRHYGDVATRVERSREEQHIRTISSPGWPDRKVRRIWEFDGRDNRNGR